MRTTQIVLYPLERRMFYVDGADFGNRTSDQYDPSCPEEGEVHPW
jgi:hypothetical protein